MSEGTPAIEDVEANRRRQHLRSIHGALGEALATLERKDRDSNIFVVLVPEAGPPEVTKHESYQAAAAAMRAFVGGGETYAYVFTGRRHALRVTPSGRVFLEVSESLDIEVGVPQEPMCVPDGALFARPPAMVTEPAQDFDPPGEQVEAPGQAPGWEPGHQDNDGFDGDDDDDGG
jgi:hypothetical protein